MKVLIASTISIILYLAFGTTVIASPYHDTTYTLKEKLQQMIPALMNQYKVPAVGVSTIEGGMISWTQVFGELKKNRPAPEDALFNTASVGKTFTALLALKLIDTKQWSLDEPLANYWIDEDIKDHPWLRKITTRHVLSHRTGFKNWRYLNASKKLGFDFEPGTDFQYSGEGMEYLQKAIEKKLKISYEKLIDSLIFKPLGMKDSQYWSDEIDLSKFAYSHDVHGEIYKNINYAKRASGAGNIHTTAKDLSKFALYIINGAGLSPALYQQMITYQGGEKSNTAFGLGWTVIKNLPDGEYALKHGGDDEGVHAMVLVLPKSKRGIVVLTNGDNGSLLIDRLTRELVSLSPETKDPKEVTLPNEVLSSYAGSYLQTDTRTLRVEHAGNVLKISAEGIPMMELTPQSANEFFIKNYGIRLAFLKDANGMMQIKIFQNDKLVMEAKRISL